MWRSAARRPRSGSSVGAGSVATVLIPEKACLPAFGLDAAQMPRSAAYTVPVTVREGP